MKHNFNFRDMFYWKEFYLNKSLFNKNEQISIMLLYE